MTYGTFREQKNWRFTRLGRTATERQQYAIVIKAFWIYNKLKRELAIYKNDLIATVYKGGTVTGPQFSHTVGSYSNPTEAAAELIEDIPKITINAGKPTEEVILSPQLWLDTVEKTLEVVGKDDKIAQDILRRRYLKNESSAVSCYELGLSKDAYYRKHNFGIGRGRDVGIQVGLIRVF